MFVMPFEDLQALPMRFMASYDFRPISTVSYFFNIASKSISGSITIQS